MRKRIFVVCRFQIRELDKSACNSVDEKGLKSASKISAAPANLTSSAHLAWTAEDSPRTCTGYSLINLYYKGLFIKVMPSPLFDFKFMIYWF